MVHHLEVVAELDDSMKNKDDDALAVGGGQSAAGTAVEEPPETAAKKEFRLRTRSSVSTSVPWKPVRRRCETTASPGSGRNASMISAPSSPSTNAPIARTGIDGVAQRSRDSGTNRAPATSAADDQGHVEGAVRGAEVVGDGGSARVRLELPIMTMTRLRHSAPSACQRRCGDVAVASTTSSSLEVKCDPRFEDGRDLPLDFK